MSRARLAQRWAVPVLRAAAFSLALALCYWFFVRTLAGQRIDDLSLGVGGFTGGGPIGAAAGVVRRGLPLLLVVLAVGVGLAAAVGRRWRRVALAVVLVTVSVGTAELLKQTLSRPDFGDLGYWYNTLPSGHTVVSAALVLAVVSLLPSADRGATTVVVVVITTAISGFASVVSQAHLTSDVLAGLLLVGVVISLVSPFSDRGLLPGGCRRLWIPAAASLTIALIALLYGAPGGELRSVGLVTLAELSSIVSVTLMVCSAAIRPRAATGRSIPRRLRIPVSPPPSGNR